MFSTLSLLSKQQNLYKQFTQSLFPKQVGIQARWDYEACRLFQSKDAADIEQETLAVRVSSRLSVFIFFIRDNMLIAQPESHCTRANRAKEIEGNKHKLKREL